MDKADVVDQAKLAELTVLRTLSISSDVLNNSLNISLIVSYNLSLN